MATTSGHMEPMLPGENGDLLELAGRLITAAKELDRIIGLSMRPSVEGVVRCLDSHYSNLIEGHCTSMDDIERAQNGDFDVDPVIRDLQIEALAHIEVQQLIDAGKMPYPAASASGIKWLHREFAGRLPEAFRILKDRATGESVVLLPGELRTLGVGVAQHIAPEPEALNHLLWRFQDAYSSRMLSRETKVIAVAAAHHRFAWIHPFLDCNGRIDRLLSHAFLRELGLVPELWSISRGLSDSYDRYMAMFTAADQPRRGDRDGRGNLSEAGLVDFCQFFLETCLGEVETLMDMVR